MHLRTSKFHRRILVLLPLVTMAILLGGNAMAKSYWFETYEHVVQLIDQGKMADASPVLDQLIKDHPVPVAGFKGPGDRFIDYFPYYQRARIEVSKGAFDKAAQSLRICEAFRAIFSSKSSEKDFYRLKGQIARQAGRRTSAEALVPSHATVMVSDRPASR